MEKLTTVTCTSLPNLKFNMNRWKNDLGEKKGKGPLIMFKKMNHP